MSYDGNGVFNRLYNWVNDSANDIPIDAERMDGEMDGFASGLSIVLTRDGQAPMIADLDFGGFSGVNLAEPIESTDAATKGYVLGQTNTKAKITVSATEPANPKEGDLWFDEDGDIALYVWVEDGVSGSWKKSAGTITIPAPVIIGDAAPGSPSVGQLWYKTSSPVGMYVRYQDADSSQWVQIAGGSETTVAALSAEVQTLTEQVDMLQTQLNTLLAMLQSNGAL